MIIFYDAATGQLRGYRKTEAEELQFPAPVGASILEIDETVNPNVVVDLDQNYLLHDVAAGVLRKSGVAVTVQPESSERAAKREIKQQIQDRLDEVQAVIDGVDASTNAQLRTMAKTIARNQKRILRLLKGML